MLNESEKPNSIDVSIGANVANEVLRPQDTFSISDSTASVAFQKDEVFSPPHEWNSSIGKADLQLKVFFENDELAQQKDEPRVLYDSRGRIRWKIRGNTQEQNEQIGIQAIQALFLQGFPEFNILFPRGMDGQIAPEKLTEARDFILDQIGITAEGFQKIFPASAMTRNTAPYFDGSHIKALKKSFFPWGISLESDNTDEISPERKIHIQQKTIEIYQKIINGEMSRYPKDFWAIGSFDPNSLSFPNKEAEERIRTIIRYAALQISQFPLDSSLLKKMGSSWFYKMRLSGALYSVNTSTRNAYNFAFKEDIENDFGFGEVLPENVGLTLLYGFLSEDFEFNRLKPFSIDLHSRTPKNTPGTNTSFDIHLAGSRNTRIDLQLTFPQEIMEGSGSAYVMPKSAMDKGDKPYYWIDFYQNLEDSGTQQPILSGQLKPGEFPKTDFVHWRGIEEQVLVDFIRGQNNIQFNDLVPFDITLSNPIHYRLGGRKNAQLRFDHLALKKGDTIKVVPKKDEEESHYWVDIFKLRSATDEQEWRNIISYRILQEEQTIVAQRWDGPEKQLFRDYLSSKPGISFSELRPIRINSTEKAKAIYIVPGAVLHIQPSLQNKDLILIPQTDEQHLYEWFDVYQYRSDGDYNNSKRLTSARITDEGLIQKGWYGPEKQLFKDHLNGTLPFERLKPIRLTREGSDIVSLWKDEGNKMYIALSQHFGLKKGDEITLVPENENANTILFTVISDSNRLGSYSLDRSTKLFKLEAIYHSIKDWDFRLNQDTGTYLDSEGVEWLTVHGLANKFRVADNVILRFLADVPFKDGTFRSGRGRFYIASTAIAAIEQSGYLQKRERLKNMRESASSGNADDLLRRFLEEE